MKNIMSFLVFLLLGIAAAAQDKPNILWIVSEDNTTLIGSYGDKTATTPNIDRLAAQGIQYDNAFCTAPVCAPSRNTLITGLYPVTLGTENMRSNYPVPQFVHFFPRYLREAGYYTTNNAKKDYNTKDQRETWDESSNRATYRNRKPGQPFFAVFNINISHESSIHQWQDSLRHSPDKVRIPAYHPATPEIRHDWAQYYDKLEDMDRQVGALLKELEEQGLADNTIVFYYADNGGVLPRSKRFMYENGLHVPLIVRFPKKYAHLAPAAAGTRTDRIVTFVDFAPTVLSLAGIPVPAHFQGQAFLGKQTGKAREYAYAFRGRMDERIDLIRSVRDKQYRYIRNYHPDKIYAQYVDYSWKSPSMRSWEKEFRAGRLNEIQARFFHVKPVEELYDVANDPDNIHNLAGRKEYAAVLERLRKANDQWLTESKDAGFIPEARREQLSKTTTIYDYTHSNAYDVAEVLKTATWASSRDAKYAGELTRRLKHKSADIRYWAANGFIVLGNKIPGAKSLLRPVLQDEDLAVRIAAAEALYKLGEKGPAIAVLKAAILDDNAMGRVQALNVWENVDGKEIAQVKDVLEGIVAAKRSEYDVRAAVRLLARM